MAIRIYPYKMGSKSATDLAREVGAKKVFPDRNYRPRTTHLIINWGSSTLPNWPTGVGHMLNSPLAISIASNKLRALQALQDSELSIPEFTTSREEAQRWVDANDGTRIVERHKLTGHSGEGIAIKSFGDDISPAPLYTKYIKKKDEFRVHVFNNDVIDVQQKRKRRDFDDANYQVRNHQNGWVFCRDGVQEPEGIRELAVAAINAIGLDFGAVDIIYNHHLNQMYILEVNTACGLEGTTLNNYSTAISNYYREFNNGFHQ